jgi:hypothetical protein
VLEDAERKSGPVFEGIIGSVMIAVFSAIDPAGARSVS